MSRSVLSQRPSGANPSTVYRVGTAWGFMYVDVRTNAVTGITPPAPGNAATFGIDVRDASVPTHVRELADRLVAYFDGEDVELVEAAALGQWLDAAGITGARRAMSLALHGVPRGVTLSYGDLAMLAGSPGAARAAGTMCARNPLPVVIPCHRVVHAGAKRGDVGSYGAANGPAYKRRLLELENAALVR